MHYFNDLFENITLYAKFDNSVAIKFSVDGVESDVSVAYGTKITDIADYATPTKVGYLFAGWKVEGVAFDTETAVTAPATFVASWKEAPWVGRTYSASTTGIYANSKNVGTLTSATATISFDENGIGTTTGTNVALNSSLRCANVASKSTRSLSILLRKIALGIFLPLRSLQSLIVSICAPSLASTTIRADSQVLKPHVTSPMKSAVPGASIKFRLLKRQLWLLKM